MPDDGPWYSLIFFSYLGCLSEPFTNHRSAGEGGGHFFNSSLPFDPLRRHLDINRAITAESSPLHIGRKAGLEPGTYGFRAQVANH